MKRRLVVLIAVVGIGVPLLVEGWTLVEMLKKPFLGSDEAPTSTVTTTDRVRAGDTILPSTRATETLSRTLLRAPRDRWELILEVRVKNATNHAYELVLGPVQTTDQTWVEGGGSGRVSPGKSRTIRGRWVLPEGTTPDVLRVKAATYDETGGPVSEVSEGVRLGKIAVQRR